MAEWKSLKGVVKYGDNYEVSTDGQVRNVITNSVLKLRSGSKIYDRKALFYEGIRHDYPTHRLVALAFIPNPNPEKYNQVNHKDGNKLNNCVENLEWTDNQGNQLHAFATGLLNLRRGAENNKTKLTEGEVVEIKQALLNGVSQYELAEKYNVTRTAITNIQKGKAWKHIKLEGFTPYTKDTKGENNHKSKLNPDKVKEIRKLYATGNFPSRKLGELFGTSKKTILDILNGKTWTHVE